MRTAPVLVAILLAAGCSKKSSDGLPPAQDWSGGQMAEAQPQPGAAKANPHGSEASGMNPHTMGSGMPPGHPPIPGWTTDTPPEIEPASTNTTTPSSH